MLKVEDMLRLCDNVGAEVELHRDVSHYTADNARWWCTIAAHKRGDSATGGVSRDEINVRRGGADGGRALIAAWMAFDRLAGEGLSLPRLAVVEHGEVEPFVRTYNPLVMAEDDGPYNQARRDPATDPFAEKPVQDDNAYTTDLDDDIPF